jgi:hypothetical protein
MQMNWNFRLYFIPRALTHRIVSDSNVSWDKKFLLFFSGFKVSTYGLQAKWLSIGFVVVCVDKPTRIIRCKNVTVWRWIRQNILLYSVNRVYVIRLRMKMSTLYINSDNIYTHADNKLGQGPNPQIPQDVFDSYFCGYTYHILTKTLKNLPTRDFANKSATILSAISTANISQKYLVTWDRFA